MARLPQIPNQHRYFVGCLRSLRRRYSREMGPLRYSINVTLDGCCDHREIPADEDLHRHAVENLNRADALLFGRVTYEMMESAWRPQAPKQARPGWMEPFARTINAAKKYVVSNTLEQVDWNAELVRGDLGMAIQQLKRESGNGLFVGGMQLPLALTDLGIDRRVRVRGASQDCGPRADVVRGAIEAGRLEAREPAGVRLGGSGDALRSETVAIELAGRSRPTTERN